MIEEKTKPFNNKLKNNLYIYSIVLYYLLLTIYFLYNEFSNVSDVLFYNLLVAYFISTIVFFIPLHTHLKNRKKNRLYVYKKISLLLRFFFLLVFNYSLHTLYYKSFDYYYRYKIIYKYVFLFAILLFISFFTENILSQLKKAKKESKDQLTFIGKLLLLIVSLFTFITSTISIYENPKEITLNDFKIPNNIEIEKIHKNPIKPTTKNDIMSFLNKYEDIGTITDEKLINKLHHELINLKIKNLVNIDKLKYSIIHEKNHPYYNLEPIYKSIGRAYNHNESTDKGYIHDIRIYKNGLFVMVNRELKYSITKDITNKDLRRYYILPISKDLKKEISHVIEKMELKKE
ncbi:MAG: hypothetical protein FH751_03060 [Firmicutes bacterium]|nr:hypothetical protein [Bacillota bacterium]